MAIFAHPAHQEDGLAHSHTHTHRDTHTVRISQSNTYPYIHNYTNLIDRLGQTRDKLGQTRTDSDRQTVRNSEVNGPQTQSRTLISRQTQDTFYTDIVINIIPVYVPLVKVPAR